MCSYTTHQHTNRAVIKTRRRPGRSVWEKTKINESTAFPHSPPSLCSSSTLSSSSLSPFVFFLSSAGLNFWPPRHHASSYPRYLLFLSLTFFPPPPLSSPLCPSLSSSPNIIALTWLSHFSQTMSRRRSAPSIIRLQRMWERVSATRKWAEGNKSVK